MVISLEVKDRGENGQQKYAENFSSAVSVSV